MVRFQSGDTVPETGAFLAIIDCLRLWWPPVHKRNASGDREAAAWNDDTDRYSHIRGLLLFRRNSLRHKWERFLLGTCHTY